MQAFYPPIPIYCHFKRDEAGTFQGMMLYLELVDESSCKLLLMNITSASGHHEGGAVLDMKFITAFSPRSQTSSISQN